MTDTHVGGCFCGAVKFRVIGEPVAMGYCHCDSCRAWSAGPVNAFSLWAPEAVKVDEGSEHVATFSKNPTSVREWCSRCGGHLFTHHPHWNLTDVYVATIPTLRFVPGVHVNYGESRLPIRDGLPKLADFPSEMGGSGASVPE